MAYLHSKSSSPTGLQKSPQLPVCAPVVHEAHFAHQLLETRKGAHAGIGRQPELPVVLVGRAATLPHAAHRGEREVRIPEGVGKLPDRGILPRLEVLSQQFPHGRTVVEPLPELAMIRRSPHANLIQQFAMQCAQGLRIARRFAPASAGSAICRGLRPVCRRASCCAGTRPRPLQTGRRGQVRLLVARHEHGQRLYRLQPVHQSTVSSTRPTANSRLAAADRRVPMSGALTR